MKPTSAFWALVLLVPFLSLAQEAPPAIKQDQGTAPAEADAPAIFDPASDAPIMIRVQVEFVEISQKDLTRLLMEDKPKSADATALRMKVQDMVDKDTCKILETQILVAKSGQQATAETAKELIYPTEYNPTSQGSDEKMKEMLASGPGSGLIQPTAFETRNMGSNLQIEPTIGEDNTIVELRFVPELVWHTGSTLWQETKDHDGNIHKFSTPDFYRINLKAAVNCISGQYNLTGVLTPHNDAGKPDFDHKIMVFLKCDILPVIK
jgi:hypothetical protein